MGVSVWCGAGGVLRASPLPATHSSMSSDIPLDRLQAFAHRLADASGDAIRPFFRTALAVDDKPGRAHYDPVTEGDRAGERAIREIIDAEFPGHGILGEEYGEKPGSDPYTWIIDPIDGTRAFMSGQPLWGTLIGCLKNGDPVLGMMDQPYTRERATATREGATWRWPGGEGPMQVRACPQIEDAVLCSTDPRMFAKGAAEDAFQALVRRSRLTRYGGDCYNYALLAMGQIDLVIEAGLAAYDILPLVPVIEAAGGVVTDWAGARLTGAYDFSRHASVIAAGDPALHAAAMDVLSGAA